MDLQIDTNETKPPELVQQYARVQNMIREKVYSKELYQTRKRYFRDRFEVLNEDD